MPPPRFDIDPIFLEAIEKLPDGISIFDQEGCPMLHNGMSEKRFPHLYGAFANGARTYVDALRHSVRQSRPDFSNDQVEKSVQHFVELAETGETYEVRTPDNRIVQVTYRPMSNGRKVAISVDVTELRQREKELANRGRELLAANAALTESQSAIRNLLDNADQGFLTVGSDLLVGSQCSAACEKLLGRPPAGKPILDLLFRDASPDTVRNMHAILTSVFLDSAESVRELKMELLPDAFSLDGRSLKAGYKFLADNGRLMLILTDVTETTRLTQEVERERQRLEMIVFAITEGETFTSLVDDYRKFLTDELPGLVDRFETAIASGDLYRQLHTHKGLLAQFSFHWSPRCLHDVETALSEGSDWTLETARAAFGSDVLLEALERDLAGVAAVLDGDASASTGSASMPPKKLKAASRIAQDVLASEEGRSASPQLRKLLRSLAEVSMIDVKSMLGLHSRGVPALASRLEKEARPVQVRGDDVCLPPDRYSAFLRSLVHVFRNAVDHGIETPEDRASAGKPAEGAITCDLRNHGEWVDIQIGDDGRGVDRSALEDKLVATGRDRGEASGLSLADLVFIEGLSSRDTASDVSGRGVGLAAVKHELDMLGGGVMVESAPGEGTLFCFRIPNRQHDLVWDATPDRKAAS